ncbi:hypothetical protein D3C86_1531090 [compost metagenome]
MQAVLVTYYKFSAEHVIGRNVIAGKQCQQRSGICVQQTVSFTAQQQVAEALKHRNRLLIRHRDGHQQRCLLAIHIKCCCCTAHRDCAADIAFCAVVQPDTLTEIQRLVVDYAGDKGGLNRTGFFQATRVQRL